MRTVNKVMLLGHATRDAELRRTSSGKAVASIRLATNRPGGGRELAQYHTVVCWEALAEQVAAAVHTGDPLYVEGRLEYRSFQDEEGKERGVAEVVAADVLFLARRADAATARAAEHERSREGSDAEELALEDLPL